MKTTLPEAITTQEQAEEFLTALWENNEVFHPEDNAHQVVWDTIPEGDRPTPSECDQLNKLMNDIYDLDGNNGDHANPIFCPCEFLLELDEEQERRNKLARPTEF